MASRTTTATEKRWMILIRRPDGSVSRPGFNRIYRNWGNREFWGYELCTGGGAHRPHKGNDPAETSKAALTDQNGEKYDGLEIVEENAYPHAPHHVR